MAGARNVAGWVQRLRQLREDVSGASAVEFAFLAPILLSVYISSFEITNGFTASGKVLKAAGSIADIVTRQPAVTKSFLNEMIDTAEATIAPHSTDNLKIKITGISIDSANNPKVLWSWDQNGNAPYTKGSVVTVPDDMKSPSSFLVHAEVSVPHTLLLFLGSGTSYGSQTRTITLSQDFFYRQRLGDDVPCSDCS